MIFGIGTDIVKISRIEKMKSQDNFADKILSETELNIFNDLNESKKNTFLAKQFAAKEAISKAFGTGLSNPILAKDIELLRDEKGKPVFNALNGVSKAVLDLGITKSHVSLSDEKHYALAFAILEI
jgi:holo-[acyl-carrier protein] synthase